MAAADVPGRCLFMLVGLLFGAVLTWHRHSPAEEFDSTSHSDISKQLKRMKLPSHKSVFLLTGAAGFVGFHTATELTRRGHTVIGLDNFNHYYDVRLKRERQARLKQAGMEPIIEGDVCDGELLRRVLREGRVTRVIHLAAQAGVRYSLKKPLEYVKANVQCFVTLLEAVKDVDKSLPITYASSSSVYGLNTKIPFHETDRIVLQASLYGATKESNERIAHVYHHLHGLRLTGLRFFTVYGPIGRPDMAYFSFTQDIISGRRITEYRKSDGTELQRDFTYVSDIVDGVIAASELGAQLEVFNLGNTHPEKVSTLIHLLEEGLGRKANITQAPISAGDVPITFADVSHARELLGYSPQVSLSEGVGRFLSWYSEYYHVPMPGLAGKQRGNGSMRRRPRRMRGLTETEVPREKAPAAAAPRVQIVAPL